MANARRSFDAVRVDNVAQGNGFDVETVILAARALNLTVQRRSGSAWIILKSLRRDVTDKD